MFLFCSGGNSRIKKKSKPLTISNLIMCYCNVLKFSDFITVENAMFEIEMLIDYM